MMPTFPPRIATASAALQSAGIDALSLTPGPDLRYLTGLGDVHAGERLLALILAARGQALWISPAMNVPQVRDSNGGIEEIRAWNDADGYLPLLQASLGDLALAGRCIAVDEEMRAAFLLDLQRADPSARCVGAGQVMRALRIRKDAEELRRLH